MNLTELELKTFAEQDALDYCLLNNINHDNIIELYLWNNELTDISGLKLFKNLKILWINSNNISDISVLKYLNNLKILYIDDNKIKDISGIKYLNNLKELNIQGLELKSDQFKYINSLRKLKEVWSFKAFKDMSILKQLNKKVLK